MLLQSRLFDLDFQLLHDFILIIIVLFCLLPFLLGICVVVKLLIKELRKK